MTELPYCGAAPLPGELLMRFNLDPALIAVLAAAAALHLWIARRETTSRLFYGMAGWSAVALALLSPLCALSVALFSARVTQHMILVLIAAPLIASGLPSRSPKTVWTVWSSTLAFFLALWFWHMPLPYDATFHSNTVYWCMHLSLFGSALWFWHALMHHSRAHAVDAFAAGMLTSIQMGMLGAFLSLGDHALFSWHLLTTWSWHLTPLADQQLGGVIMWVPGVVIFLWVSMRALSQLWVSLERARTT